MKGELSGLGRSLEHNGACIVARWKISRYWDVSGTKRGSGRLDVDRSLSPLTLRMLTLRLLVHILIDEGHISLL